MNFEGMFVDYRVEKAVLESIARYGIDTVDVEAVASVLGRSRASLYRQYGNLKALMRYTHRQSLEGIDTLFVCQRGERRLEFDAWWGQVTDFLRQPCGGAFRVLRARIHTDALMQEELRALPNLVEWVGQHSSPLRPTTDAVALAAWQLLLSAASSPLGSSTEVGLRELTWSISGTVESALSEEPDFDVALPLAEHLTGQQ